MAERKRLMVRATASRRVGGTPKSSSGAWGRVRRWTPLGMGFPTVVVPRYSSDWNIVKSKKGRERWRGVR